MKKRLTLAVVAIFSAFSSFATTEAELGKLLLKENHKKITQSYNAYYSKGPTSSSTKGGYHPGIDYRATVGTKVYSPVSGKVHSIDTSKYGRLTIDLGNGHYFMLLHLSSMAVKKGSSVKVGDYIGKSGEVGAPGAPHLHVEYRKGKTGASWYFKSSSSTGSNLDPTKAVATKSNSTSSASSEASGGQILKGNLALNAHAPKKYSKVNLWNSSKTDPDQRWVIDRNQISRAGTNYCLNTPDRKNSGKVFMWPCNKSDADQKWKLYNLGGNIVQIRLKDTNYCLNAYKPKHGSAINIYKCDTKDTDQQFTVKGN